MSIASQLGLAPKKDSVAGQVGLSPSQPSTSKPVAGTPIGSGAGGGTLVSDPTSPGGAREVPMSPSPTTTTRRSSGRSSSGSSSRPSISQIQQTQTETQNMSPSAGYIQQPVKFDEPKTTTTSAGVPSYVYTGTVDYTGIKQQPGETKQQFDARVQSIVSARAQSEASRLASKKPPGSQVSVELRYTSPLYQERPSNIATNQPMRQPYTPFQINIEPRYVVKTPEETREVTSKTIVSSTEFGAKAQPGNITVATKNEAGLTRGGVSPNIKPNFTERVAFQIESKIIKSAKYEGLSEEQFASAFRDPKVTPVVGSISTAGRFIKTEVVPFITKPVAEGDFAYSRAGDFVVGGAVSAVGDVLSDPLKYAALYGAGASLGFVGGKVTGKVAGVIQGSSTLFRKYEASKPFLKAGGIVVGTGVAGVVGYDIAKSADPIARFGTVIAEGTSFGVGFAQSFKPMFKSVSAGVSKAKWDKTFTQYQYDQVRKGDVVMTDFTRTGQGQTTLFGGTASNVPKSSPLGLPPEVSNRLVQSGRAFIPEKGVGVTRIEPFWTVQTQATPTGYKFTGNLNFESNLVILKKYGAEMKGFSSTNVNLLFKDSGIRTTSLEGYSRLLQGDKKGFVFLKADDMFKFSAKPSSTASRGVQLTFDDFGKITKPKPAPKPSVAPKVKTNIQPNDVVVVDYTGGSGGQGRLYSLALPVPTPSDIAQLTSGAKAIGSGFSNVATRTTNLARSVVASSVASPSAAGFGSVSQFGTGFGAVSVARSAIRIENDLSSSVVSPTRTFNFQDVVTSYGSKETTKSEGEVKSSPVVVPFVRSGASNLGISGSEPNVGVSSVSMPSSASTSIAGAKASSPSKGSASSSVISIGETPVTSIGRGGSGLGGTNIFNYRFLPPKPSFNIPSGSVGGFRPQVGERSGFFGAWKTAKAGKAFLTNGVETLRLGGSAPNRVGAVVRRDSRSPRRKKKEFWWDVELKL